MGEVEVEETKPIHKIGDIVTIKKRTGKDTDYRCCFTSVMASRIGEQLKVVGVRRGDDKVHHVLTDDGYIYELEGSCFNWASSMFEAPSDNYLPCYNPELKDIEPFIRRKKCPELDFN